MSALGAYMFTCLIRWHWSLLIIMSERVRAQVRVDKVSSCMFIRDMHRVRQKCKPPISFYFWLHQIVSDFQNSFTDKFSSKFAITWWIKILPQLKRVGTLPVKCYRQFLNTQNYTVVWQRVWGLAGSFNCKFSVGCTGGRILKIVQYLTKLSSYEIW